jgi:hypothetical protein
MMVAAEIDKHGEIDSVFDITPDWFSMDPDPHGNPDFSDDPDQSNYMRYTVINAPTAYRALLSLTVILAYLRSFVILIPFRRYGKLILMVFRMVEDVKNFSVLFLLIALAFAVSFMSLFQNDPDHFFSLGDSLEYVVFAVLGQFDVGTRHTEFSMNELLESSSQLLRVYGRSLFFVLQTLIVILLVNLLVAMMSNTYDAIEEQNEEEWLVAQSGLLNDFALKIRSVGDLPLFNLIGCVQLHGNMPYHAPPVASCIHTASASSSLSC